MQDLAVDWTPLPDSPATGGALAIAGDLLLVVQPSGELLWYNVAQASGPFATDVVAPMNRAALLRSEVAADPAMNMKWFRVTGAYAETAGDVILLYVVHHVFEAACFFLQVSAIDLRFDPELGLAAASDWRSVFRPSPCIGLTDSSGRRFAGHQAGGKIVARDREHLLVAYGDHEIDGVRSPESPQDDRLPYGKIWEIAKDGSGARVFASGLRNPQGLFVDDQGRVWESEHGPQGGDELNLIRDGANYGWPEQTLGVGYGNFFWPLNETQGRHADPRFSPPVFAWAPSIAPSNLTQIVSSKFKFWQRDLLLATLKDQSLRRLRISGGRVIYDEAIKIGERIRDIVSLNDGRIAVLADRPLLGIIDDPGQKLRSCKPLLVMETPAAMGEAVFERACTGCHNAEGSAPSLAGLPGRPIGKEGGYDYSDALAAATGTWDLAKFSAFVRDPAELFPGSKMPPADISETEAAHIYAYLGETAALETTGQARFDAGSGVGGFEAPFTLRFTEGGARRAHAYQAFLPDVWIGFDPKSDADVFVEQVPMDKAANASVDRYGLDMDIRDPKSSTWVTLETSIQPLESEAMQAEVTVTGSADPPARVNWQLAIPTRQGDVRIPLGEMRLPKEEATGTLHASFDLSTISDRTRLFCPHVLMFLPTSPTRIRLDDYSITFSPAPTAH